MATTSWSDIISASMNIIDDIRWTEQLTTNPAQFYRAKSALVSLALPMLSRPVELLQYLQNGMTAPSYDSAEWVSTEASTTAAIVVNTGITGYELCSVVVRSEDGLSVSAYTDAVYDSETGEITFPIQSEEGIEYDIDFYTDGTFAELSPTMLRLFALAVAVVWDERFERNWLNIQMHLKDASFEVVNESNYMAKTNERLRANQLAFNDELRKFEQDMAYLKVFSGGIQQRLTY